MPHFPLAAMQLNVCALWFLSRFYRMFTALFEKSTKFLRPAAVLKNDHVSS